MTLKGYSRLRLDVDLTKGTITKREIPEEFCTDWIGGLGFSAKVLWDECPADADPLGPDNVLVYSHGPFPTSNLPTSSKYMLSARSPATKLWGYSISSGSVAQQARRAGIGMIVFYGQSPEPVYFLADGKDNYKLVPCGEGSELPLWGKGCWDVEDLVREFYGDQRIAVATIGPAGEGGKTGKPSAIGCVTNDRNRQAGRTGMGGVMGSKKLKALVFRGEESVEPADPEVYKFFGQMIKRSMGAATQKYRDLGTPAGLLPYNKLGMLCVRNNQEGAYDDEKASYFSGETLNAKYVVKKVACSQCPIACDHIAQVPLDHPYWPGVTASVDIESCYSMGSSPDIEIKDENGVDMMWPTVIKGIEVADTLGMDSISSGSTVAMAFECYEKGIITKDMLSPELQEIGFGFGNGRALVRFLEEMGTRSTELGDIFADGTRAAAERLGGDAKKYAMNVKGLEFPMFDIHGMSSFSVGVSVSLRGACHLRNAAYGLDAKGKFDRFAWDKPDERGKAIKDADDEYIIIDSFIICKFTRGIYESKTDYAKVYELMTGYPMTQEKLWWNAERIHNLGKCLNLRWGATREDDYPPDRFFTEAPTRGSVKGVTLDRKGYDAVLDGYYKARGWDSKGVPTKETLERLKLDFVNIDEIAGGK
ncbi:MAG: aldehyde ferredoxin oxidoreductase family protein [Promethearchaeota archaeon]